MLIVAIIIILTVLFILMYMAAKKDYEETEYYHQTQKSFGRVLSNSGTFGEYKTWDALNGLDGYNKCLFNCYVPKSNGGTTEIDVILLHESGIYVFESKNYSGWIFGSESQQYWTQTLRARYGGSHKYRFLNPILQNKGHIKWLSKYLGKKPDMFYSYIVFGDECTFKNLTVTSNQYHVIKRHEIKSEITLNIQSHGRILSSEEIDALYSKLLPLTQVDESTKQAHIDSIKSRKESEAYSSITTTTVANVANDSMICPRCGGKLVLRTASKGKYAGQQFYGCSHYPQCKFIRNIT